MLRGAGEISGRFGMIARQFLQEFIQDGIARDPQLASEAIEQRQSAGWRLMRRMFAGGFNRLGSTVASWAGVPANNRRG
jgi:hypothetical protein